MFNWLRELKEIWNDQGPMPECPSCEVLKTELTYERLEKQRLLDRILQPQVQVPERTVAPEPMVDVKPRYIPWKVRQQMLEQADKEKAEVIRSFQKKNDELKRMQTPTAPITPATSIEDLEANLGIVAGDN